MAGRTIDAKTGKSSTITTQTPSRVVRQTASQRSNDGTVKASASQTLGNAIGKPNSGGYLSNVIGGDYNNANNSVLNNNINYNNVNSNKKYTAEQSAIAGVDLNTDYQSNIDYFNSIGNHQGAKLFEDLRRKKLDYLSSLAPNPTYNNPVTNSFGKSVADMGGDSNTPASKEFMKRNGFGYQVLGGKIYRYGDDDNLVYSGDGMNERTKELYFNNRADAEDYANRRVNTDPNFNREYLTDRGVLDPNYIDAVMKGETADYAKQLEIAKQKQLEAAELARKRALATQYNENAYREVQPQPKVSASSRVVNQNSFEADDAYNKYVDSIMRNNLRRI